MRQIQIVVPDSRIREFTEILLSYDKNLLHMKATGPQDTIVVHVEEGKVDEVVEMLKGRGLEREGSIILLPPGVAIMDTELGEPVAPPETIAPRVELMLTARRSSELTRSFFYLTVISAFVATLGLLMDSTAAVIGAMVIAPLLGPAISICVGTVLGESRLFRHALVNTLIGLAIAIVISTITAWLAVNSGLIPPLLDLRTELPKEILERANLNLLNIGLALASGAAGAYSFAKGKGETLMGVMIAVALMPPACTAGIGLALWKPLIFTGAILILLVNVVCIALAGTLVLWRAGVQPMRYFKKKESSQSVRRRLVTTAVILIILGGFFAYSTYGAFRDYQFKEEVQEETLSLARSIENVTDAEVDSIAIDGRSVDVRVTVFIGGEGLPSGCAEAIREGLAARFGDGYDFSAKVVFERQDTSG